MHRTKAVLTAFYNIINGLSNNPLINNVVKTNIDSERNYPMVSVTMGADVREEYTKEMYLQRLTMYTALFVESTNKNLDETLLDMREIIENEVYRSGKMNIDYVFREPVLLSASAPDYNRAAVDYAGTIVLEWEIQFFTEHDNASL